MKRENYKVLVKDTKTLHNQLRGLKALGEKVNKDDLKFPVSDMAINQGGLYFNEKFKIWCVASSFSGQQKDNREVVDFKELIRLLVNNEDIKKSMNVPLFDVDNQCIIYSENKEVRIWTKGGGVGIKHSDIEDIYQALKTLNNE